MKLKCLFGLESSATIREEFEKRGHECMSCDLLDTDIPGQHYKGDIFDVIDYPWDFAIFHPPCTHTAVSGAAHFQAKKLDGRQQAAVSFFMKIVRRSEHIRFRAVEQPISIMSTEYGKPSQIIQPYEFGHCESKATCLWLFGLPPLMPTMIVEGRIVNGKMRYNNQTDSGQNKLPPSDDRWKLRAKTYQGIAEAMADQWGNFMTTAKEATCRR